MKVINEHYYEVVEQPIDFAHKLVDNGTGVKFVNLFDAEEFIKNKGLTGFYKPVKKFNSFVIYESFDEYESVKQCTL